MHILSYAKLTHNGTKLVLPSAKEYPMSKTDYSDLKRALLKCKAIWLGNQTFEFPFNATGIIDRLINGDNVDLSKLQLFPTPMGIAREMWDSLLYYIGFEPNAEMKVLEPNAGTGSLIERLFYYYDFECIDYCEICPEYEDILVSNVGTSRTKKVGTDFLKLQAKDTYDLVFANPPFASDTKHLAKMLEVCKPNGYICTLLGEGFYNKYTKDDLRDFFAKYKDVDVVDMTMCEKVESKDKDEWHFDSTPAGYTRLTLRKKAETEIAPAKVSTQMAMF